MHDNPVSRETSPLSTKISPFRLTVIRLRGGHDRLRLLYRHLAHDGRLFASASPTPPPVSGPRLHDNNWPHPSTRRSIHSTAISPDGCHLAIASGGTRNCGPIRPIICQLLQQGFDLSDKPHFQVANLRRSAFPSSSINSLGREKVEVARRKPGAPPVLKNSPQRTPTLLP
ncbi:hypothetical protein BDN67DRAFT_104764 [Paxillus ammoniavirescens]|nr:hypothetical protein BDN67DRAFT_104764 [Paxillus ammoniavirescens]